MRKLQQFNNQQDGQLTKKSNNFSEYGIGTQILKKLGINNFKIISQNPDQKPMISGYGVKVSEIVPL